MSSFKIFFHRYFVMARLLVIDLLFAVKHFFAPSVSRIVQGDLNSKEIAIVAIYQKNQIRDDILFVITSLSRLGCDVIIVNTAKVDNPIFDYPNVTYIERPNWGRDFGSYKLGIDYINKKIVPSRINRLLILNDSVFYSERNLETFLKHALQDRSPVTAVSENHNIKWHYGSFFLAFGPAVIGSPIFIDFWRKYQLTNRRQATIRRGEMGLSDCVKMILGPDQLPPPLLTIERISEVWEEQRLGNTPFLFWPSGPTSGWQNPKALLDKLMSEIFTGLDNINFEMTIAADKTSITGIHIDRKTELNDIWQFLSQSGVHISPERLTTWFLSSFLTNFENGSQIHQAGLLAPLCGVPLLKLDVIFRGNYSFADIDWLSTHLPSQQQKVYLSLFSRQRYGASYLVGWRRTAFLFHLM